MKRILITRGAGFVGSNLCERLVKDTDNYVICLDNMLTGKFNNIEKLTKLSNFDSIDVMK